MGKLRSLLEAEGQADHAGSPCAPVGYRQAWNERPGAIGAWQEGLESPQYNNYHEPLLSILTIYINP
jgi:hypothetical protein